jgi:amino acid permease
MFPIIDLSRQTIREFEASDFTHGRARLYTLWFRVARPALVTLMWALVGFHLYRCYVESQHEGVDSSLFISSLTGISLVVTAFIVWAVTRRLTRRRREQSVAFDQVSVRTYEATGDARVVANRGRRLVAYHDDSGVVSRVTGVSDHVTSAS